MGWAQPDPDKIEDAEHDIQNREEELKAELELTTQRCEELRKTLHDTKKYIAHRTVASTTVSESITGRRPARDIFKPLYLAQIELVFHYS